MLNKKNTYAKKKRPDTDAKETQPNTDANRLLLHPPLPHTPHTETLPHILSVENTFFSAYYREHILSHPPPPPDKPPNRKSTTPRHTNTLRYSPHNHASTQPAGRKKRKKGGKEGKTRPRNLWSWPKGAVFPRYLSVGRGGGGGGGGGVAVAR